MSFADDFDVIEAKLILEDELKGDASEVDPDEDEKIVWDNQEKPQKIVWMLRMKTGVLLGLFGFILTAFRFFGGGININ